MYEANYGKIPELNFTNFMYLKCECKQSYIIYTLHIDIVDSLVLHAVIDWNIAQVLNLRHLRHDIQGLC